MVREFLKRPGLELLALHPAPRAAVADYLKHYPDASLEELERDRKQQKEKIIP